MASTPYGYPPPHKHSPAIIAVVVAVVLIVILLLLVVVPFPQSKSMTVACNRLTNGAANYQDTIIPAGATTVTWTGSSAYTQLWVASGSTPYSNSPGYSNVPGYSGSGSGSFQSVGGTYAIWCYTEFGVGTASVTISYSTPLV